MMILRVRAAIRSLIAVAVLAGFAPGVSVALVAPEASPSTAAKVAPPVAEKKPRTEERFGVTLVDNYFWLREKESQKVIDHLNSENGYTKSVMAHTEGLQEKLYKEMLGRIKETDLSVPYRKGEYFYYTRTEEGKPFPIYCRTKGANGSEEILLDQNAQATAMNAKFLSLGTFDVSPDHSMLAVSFDINGSERYTLKFKNLKTGEWLPDEVPDTYYSSAWANDNKTFFYTTQDDASRPDKLWRHTLGVPAKNDVMVFHEPDERFRLGVFKTRSNGFIMIELGSNSQSEWHALDANTPNGAFGVILPKKDKVEYEVDHHGDRFYIVTNDGAVNFKLVSVPTSAPQSEQTLLMPGSSDVTIESVNCFKNHLVIDTHERGLPNFRVRTYGSPVAEHTIAFPEAAYDAGFSDNEEFDTPLLRFTYSSPITPRSVFDYDMNTKERTLLKEQPVLGGYDRTLYSVERHAARAPDGTMVPVSLVYKKSLFKRDGSNPCLLNGYGSYGAAYDAGFSSNAISLLDRGFVFAIAHIRGGSENGRTWYEDGRLMNKKNTFTDFISSAEYLVKEKFTCSSKLAISGGSAGGLLMGAVVNMRPDLFKVVVAAVPFVDVINTMSDPSIPLTVSEWEQWGNPCTDEEAFKYMLSYSPYDNVGAKPYPNMLVLAGLNDPRVAYWEPAKWTAKLREMAFNTSTPSVQSGAVLCLKTNMGAGHGGASDRYERLKEIALQYAFILDRIGVSE